MAPKRAAESGADSDAKKPRKGFRTGPENLPDGPWRRKGEFPPLPSPQQARPTNSHQSKRKRRISSTRPRSRSSMQRSRRESSRRRRPRSSPPSSHQHSRTRATMASTRHLTPNRPPRRTLNPQCRRQHQHQHQHQRQRQRQNPNRQRHRVRTRQKSTRVAMR